MPYRIFAMILALGLTATSFAGPFCCGGDGGGDDVVISGQDKKFAKTADSPLSQAVKQVQAQEARANLADAKTDEKDVTLAAATKESPSDAKLAGKECPTTADCPPFACSPEKKAKMAAAKDCGPASCDADKGQMADAKKDGEQVVSTYTLQSALASDQPVILIDARSGKYDDGRRIPGAKQLAVNASDADIKRVAGADKHARIVTYCGSQKCPLSKKLAKRLRDAGYENVFAYEAGLSGWVSAGNDVDELAGN